MISDYYDFFLFLGVLPILGVIIYLLPLRYPKDIIIPIPKISLPKISISVILLIIIIGGFLLNQLLMWRLFSFGSLEKLLPTITINITKKV